MHNLTRFMQRILKDQLTGLVTINSLIAEFQHSFLIYIYCTSCHLEFYMATQNGCCAHLPWNDRGGSSHFPLAKLHGLVDPLYSRLIRLSDGSKVAHIKGIWSQTQQITSGVIQISVLGLLLFLLCVNEVFQAICQGTPFLVPDDIKLVCSFGPPFPSHTMANITGT